MMKNNYYIVIVFSKLDIGHLWWENGGVRSLPFLLLDKNQLASFTPNSVFLSSHHDDLGSKCAYTCHLSNKLAISEEC